MITSGQRVRRLLLVAVGLFACGAGMAADARHAVSLRVLQSRLETCQQRASAPCADVLTHLAGLTRIEGYILDPATGDVILIGKRDAAAPRLHTADLAVALRSAFFRYATGQGRDRTYSNPGCSIDPSSDVLAALDEISARFRSSTSALSMDAAIEAWRNTCRLPQQVRVLGIPFDTRFAKVMVAADYDMKRVVDGTDDLELQDFRSLKQLTLDTVRAQVAEHGQASAGVAGLNRFWFYPGPNRFREGEDAVLLERSPVLLLTEAQYVDAQGNASGTGQSNSLASQFTQAFSERYDEIAARRPIYAELEGLFRFVAVAKVLKLRHRGASEKALAFLLDRYHVPEVTVERELPGRSAVGALDMNLPGGSARMRLRLPSCGGVGIEIELDDDDLVMDAALANLSADALKARPHGDALSWSLTRGNAR